MQQSTLSDTDILAAYEPPPGTFVRFNFVSTLDGAATHDGVSGAIGGPADKRAFALQRRWADVVLIGAGTIRAEGYAGELVDAAGQRWRTARGLAAHPAIAVVSGSLGLEPDSEFFTRAPVRPLLLTTDAAANDPAKAPLAEVADVVALGESVQPRAVTEYLAGRGLRVIHSEGGPRLLGSFIAADAVDSLCLTLSPVLAGSDAPRISSGPAGDLRRMRLERILHEDGELLLEYRRP
ncbi:pyrimidine reductase family protein [Zhihengliuella salsuginis]|uniref:Bacterial bifunctional deaminase-reductase C-terminal domain-containing protein n=1 Tax=Zhihengliuella salsuginis TaxID=578222 RepID=A0ABQ3GH85_9MICC|nr:pyrimidine reductase family protein [Zhihengliuella salsuginis]GHD03585.1 hypothetical protein GCM10008096_09760 [Zhihengliuella salsuginis]